MRKYVIKRDGTETRFEKSNILNTIAAAYKEVHSDRGEAIAMDTARFVYKTNIRNWLVSQGYRKLKTDEIRTVVERALMQHCPAVAKAYIIKGYIDHNENKEN